MKGMKDMKKIKWFSFMRFMVESSYSIRSASIGSRLAACLAG
jgi:hypothetical protein